MDTNITNILVTVLIFSGIVIGFSGFLQGVLTTYGKYGEMTATEQQAITNLNVINQVNKTVTQPMKAKIESTKLGLVETVSYLLTSLYESVKLLLEVPLILIGIVGNISALMSGLLPVWVVTMVNAIIFIFIILSIIAIILKVSEI